jgi:dodecin
LPVSLKETGGNMPIAKTTELISSSKKSFEDAVAEGVKRADKTLANVRGAWIKDQKVVVEKGKIVEYRVFMRVTFVLKS